MSILEHLKQDVQIPVMKSKQICDFGQTRPVASLVSYPSQQFRGKLVLLICQIPLINQDNKFLVTIKIRTLCTCVTDRFVKKTCRNCNDQNKRWFHKGSNWVIWYCGWWSEQNIWANHMKGHTLKLSAGVRSNYRIPHQTTSVWPDRYNGTSNWLCEDH